MTYRTDPAIGRARAACWDALAMLAAVTLAATAAIILIVETALILMEIMP